MHTFRDGGSPAVPDVERVLTSMRDAFGARRGGQRPAHSVTTPRGVDVGCYEFRDDGRARSEARLRP